MRYGPHPRNVLDLYLAESDRPTPLVLYIHGGGFRGGDKRSLNPNDGRSYLEAGFSIAAINYRLTDTAPMPAAYLDCARALQFLRHHASRFNLNPQLVASTGGSAGAGTSMWLAFHDDLADPEAEDPVARQSTRLSCIVVRNGQSSYDPRFAEKIGIPRPNFERHPFFLPFYGIQADEIETPRAYELYEQAAPITYVTADDPPALLLYTYANEDVDQSSSLGLVVHHPKFGIALKQRLDELDIKSIVQYPERGGRRLVRHGSDQPPIRAVDFIRTQFERAAGPQLESSINTLSQEEKDAGWRLLFDGQTTEGWRGYKMEKMPPGWQVIDGALVRVAGGAGGKGAGGGDDIITLEQFDNFELTLQWRIVPGGNSGVLFRVTEDAMTSWHVAPEMQVLDNSKHLQRDKRQLAGALYDLYAPIKDMTNPPGRWNTARIVARGPHVEHWLNGVKLLEYQLDSDDWKERVANSKFKDKPDFARAAKGHICLQDHSDRVEFCNIKIRPLRAAP